jgi:hypothetical protein
MSARPPTMVFSSRALVIQLALAGISGKESDSIRGGPAISFYHLSGLCRRHHDTLSVASLARS